MDETVEVVRPHRLMGSKARQAQQALPSPFALPPRFATTVSVCSSPRDLVLASTLHDVKTGVSYTSGDDRSYPYRIFSDLWDLWNTVAANHYLLSALLPRQAHIQDPGEQLALPW